MLDAEHEQVEHQDTSLSPAWALPGADAMRFLRGRVAARDRDQGGGDRRVSAPIFEDSTTAAASIGAADFISSIRARGSSSSDFTCANQAR